MHSINNQKSHVLCRFCILRSPRQNLHMNVQVTEACWRHLQSSLWTHRNSVRDKGDLDNLRCQKHKWPKITNYKLIQNTWYIITVSQKLYHWSKNKWTLWLKIFGLSLIIYICMVTRSFWRNVSAHHVHPLITQTQPLFFNVCSNSKDSCQRLPLQHEDRAFCKSPQELQHGGGNTWMPTNLTMICHNQVEQVEHYDKVCSYVSYVFIQKNHQRYRYGRQKHSCRNM